MEDIEGIKERVEALIEEGRSGEEVFQFLSPFLRENPWIEEGIAERLGHLPRETAVKVLLLMMKKPGDKKVQKTIRRSLYRLKSKGIPVEETDIERGPSILRPLQAEPPNGFGTGFDLHGERLLMLVIPHASRGWTVMHGVVSDTRGLINFVGEEMTRREFRDFFDRFREKIPFTLVEMEAPYVGFLLFRAYRLTLERKGTPPQDYLRLKGEVERAKKEYGQPLIYSFLSLEEISGDERWVSRGGELLKDDLFAAWGIEEDRARPYTKAITEAQESKLFLSQDQKQARIQEVYLKALMEIFSDDVRSIFKHRLEETAYIFHQQGKEEEAKISVAVAMDLEKPLNPISPNPFLFQLVVRSLLVLLSEDDEKEKREPSLIVRP
jgi:hypothetical protein